MAELAETDAGLLARAPSAGLVVGAIASVQFGSAIAATLFSRIGPAGAVTLRLVVGHRGAARAVAAADQGPVARASSGSRPRSGWCSPG